MPFFDRRSNSLSALPSSRRVARMAFAVLVGWTVPVAWTVLVAWTLLPLTGSALHAQTIEEEDLPDLELDAVLAVEEPLSDDQLALRLAEAQDLFHWQEPAAAAAPLDDLIERLEMRRKAGEEFSERARAFLVRALGYRARVRFHLATDGLAAKTVGDDVEADLGRLLELAPAAELPDDAPVELRRSLAALRKERVGTLELRLEPPDVVLRLDGERVELPDLPLDTSADGGGDVETEPVASSTVRTEVLAGSRRLTAERPGYVPTEIDLEIPAAKTTAVDLRLVRRSAIVRLATRPAGAEVLIDGAPRGVTTGTAEEGSLPAGAVAVFGREEFSSHLVIDPVETGLRLVEVRKPGFRSYRAELLIEDLLDYPLPPIVLEDESAFLVLRDLPPGAEVLIDGALADLSGRGAAPRFELEPGEHDLQVTRGATRVFSTRVRLADRQTAEIAVRLRPGLAWLGVLGERTAAAILDDAVRLAFERSEKWALLDRRENSAAVLAGADLDLAALRAAAAGASADWKRLQAAADAAAPGLLYALAVLDDDLLPRAADLWIWPAAPGPARPDRIRIRLDDRDAASRLAELFHHREADRRPWLGGLLIQAGNVDGPMIADITPGGPLEQAGARVGERITAVAGVPVRSPGDVQARLAAAESGESLELTLVAPGVQRNTWMRLGSSPWAAPTPSPADGDGKRPASLVWADSLLLEESAAAEDLWILRLIQARLLLRDGRPDEAVRRLRDLEAPRVPHGFGRAALDYWLGVALSRAGASSLDAAREALTRAVRVPGARLEHHDGPWVAPRARARLRALGGS